MDDYWDIFEETDEYVTYRHPNWKQEWTDEIRARVDRVKQNQIAEISPSIIREIESLGE